MQLIELFEGVRTREEIPSQEVDFLTADTRKITHNTVFFCLRGFSGDGHDYAAKALEAGAAAIVVERDLGLPKQLLVEDTHLALSLCAANFFGNPQRKMTLIGVTGTNGKTTVTHLIRDMLRGAGYKTGLVGTVSAEVGDFEIPARYTTPDPMSFHALLAQMVAAGCTHAVMETSSHGLDQKRVGSCHFAVGVFTNLTQDHLDYHKTMEGYFTAKKSLFSACDRAIVNYDDAYGRRLLTECPCPVQSFSIRADAADFTAKDIRLAVDGSRFVFVAKEEIARVKIPVPGEFSVENAMAALGAGMALGLPLPVMTGALEKTAGVPGRFEVLRTTADFTIIRDYAHSPDSMQKMLETLRKVTDQRIMVLFGCPGERDRTKRHLMTDAAASLADFVVLTSDNPRSEPEQQVIDDAMPGLLAHDTPYRVFLDRYEAITWALSACKPGEILVLAGKGHEDYQVLSHGSIHFDEREVVRELLAKQQK